MFLYIFLSLFFTHINIGKKYHELVSFLTIFIPIRCPNSYWYFSECSLQRKLREISTKYQLFQKPANFEQRMLDCKRVLDGAKAELHILDVREVEPEKIQFHLNGCMVRAFLLSTTISFLDRATLSFTQVKETTGHVSRGICQPSYSFLLTKTYSLAHYTNFRSFHYTEIVQVAE